MQPDQTGPEFGAEESSATSSRLRESQARRKQLASADAAAWGRDDSGRMVVRDWRPRRGEFFRNRPGILPKRAVRTAAFGVISLSIFACGVLCLLAVWDYATSGVSWRAIASLGIIAGTMAAFAFVNEFFSDAEAQADATPAAKMKAAPAPAAEGATA